MSHVHAVLTNTTDQTIKRK